LPRSQQFPKGKLIHVEPIDEEEKLVQDHSNPLLAEIWEAERRYKTPLETISEEKQSESHQSIPSNNV